MFEKGDGVVFFSGIEKEGSLQGYPTLFVVGDQSFEDIKKHWEAGEYKQIYFGAKFQTPFSNFGTIRQFREAYDATITIEMLYAKHDTMPNDIFDSPAYRKIFVAPFPKKRTTLNNNIIMKVETISGVACYENSIFNDWDVYGEDTVLQTSEEGVI